MISTPISDAADLYYIGVRSSKCEPELDTSYMGSSRILSYMISCGIVFKKQVIETYGTREEADENEQEIFDFTGGVDNINCINLHSYRNPCVDGRAANKLEYYKKNFKQLVTYYSHDRFNKIALKDMDYCVRKNPNIWYFVEHPENIKTYYPTTGTISYWPGRTDKLMTKTSTGKTKFFTTDVEKVSGSPLEQIEELFANHFVSGQRTPVLELVEFCMSQLSDDDWRDAMDLYFKYAGDSKYDWITKRVRHDRLSRKVKAAPKYSQCSA